MAGGLNAAQAACNCTHSRTRPPTTSPAAGPTRPSAPSRHRPRPGPTCPAVPPRPVTPREERRCQERAAHHATEALFFPDAGYRQMGHPTHRRMGSNVDPAAGNICQLPRSEETYIAPQKTSNPRSGILRNHSHWTRNTRSASLADWNLLTSCDLCMGSRFWGRADKVLENDEF